MTAETSESAAWEEGPDDAEFFSPPTANGTGAPETEAPEYESILGAPDYASFIKVTQSARSKEYTTRVRSILKAGVFGAMQAQDLIDAATILHYGPGFASATGELAASNETVAHTVDILTSPNNPALMFLAAAVPFAAQLFRNHEPEIRQMTSAESRAARKAEKKRRKAEAAASPNGAAEFHVPGIKRPFRIKFRLRFNMGSFFGVVRAQTQEPAILAASVFSDPKLQRELAKQGIIITMTKPD